MIVTRVDYPVPGISWAIPGIKYKVYRIYFLGLPIYTRKKIFITKKD